MCYGTFTGHRRNSFVEVCALVSGSLQSPTPAVVFSAIGSPSVTPFTATLTLGCSLTSIIATVTENVVFFLPRLAKIDLAAHRSASPGTITGLLSYACAPRVCNYIYFHTLTKNARVFSTLLDFSGLVSAPAKSTTYTLFGTKKKLKPFVLITIHTHRGRGYLHFGVRPVAHPAP